MAKNKMRPILSEEITRKWGKMAKINEALTEKHIQKMFEGEEEEEKEEEEELPPGPSADLPKDAEVPPPSEEPTAAVPEEKVTELVQAIADTITAETGVPVAVEGAKAEEPVSEPIPEPEPEVPGEEKEEVPPPAPEDEKAPLEEGDKMKTGAAGSPQTVEKGLLQKTTKTVSKDKNASALENEELLEELVNRVYNRLRSHVQEALNKKSAALKK